MDLRRDLGSLAEYGSKKKRRPVDKQIDKQRTKFGRVVSQPCDARVSTSLFDRRSPAPRLQSKASSRQRRRRARAFEESLSRFSWSLATLKEIRSFQRGSIGDEAPDQLPFSACPVSEAPRAHRDSAQGFHFSASFWVNDS